jgi:hypothetical protein
MGLYLGLGGEKPAMTVHLNFHGVLDACHGSYSKLQNTEADLLYSLSPCTVAMLTVRTA